MYNSNSKDNKNMTSILSVITAKIDFFRTFVEDIDLRNDED